MNRVWREGGLILRCHKFRVSEESLFGGNALLTHPARKGCVERASSLRGERFFRHDEMTARTPCPNYAMSSRRLLQVEVAPKRGHIISHRLYKHNASFRYRHVGRTFRSPFCRIAKKCHRSVRPSSGRRGLRAYGSYRRRNTLLARKEKGGTR